MNPGSGNESRRDLLLAARGGGVKLGGSALTSVAGLAISLLITRMLGASGFGEYRIGVIFSELISQVAGLGLRSSALRFAPIAWANRDAARLEGIARSTTAAPILFAILLAAVVFAGAESIASRVFDAPELAPVLRVFAFAIPLAAGSHALEALLRAVHRVDLSIAGHDVGFQLPKILFTAAALFLGFGVVGAGFAHIAALVVSVLLMGSMLRSLLASFGPRSAPPDYRPRELMSQAVPMYATNLLRAFSGSLETLLLGVFGVASGVGIYAAALQLVRVAGLLPEAFSSVTMPLISAAWDRGGAEEVRPLLKVVARWSLTATLPIVTIVALWAEPLLAVFGKEFLAGRAGVVLLSAVPVMNAAFGLCNAVLAMTGHARLNAINWSAFIAAALALDLLLIPRYGVEGAALAVVGSNLFFNALRVGEVFWLFRMGPLDRHFLKPAVAWIAAAAAGWAAQSLLAGLHPVLAVLCGIGCLVLVYAAVLLGLGLSESDRVVLDAVRRRLGQGR